MKQNGEEALVIAGNDYIDLILVDIVMPVKDGFSCPGVATTRSNPGIRANHTLYSQNPQKFYAVSISIIPLNALIGTSP
ncbi:hypothetical protein [Desulfosediminicola ganghwensis]|uniref:hypothetical protein n=1 Tax=Desulfosediminicola ganghwensis TaxID=2569540 RepID=UPI0010AD2A1B|nr:hypothetical protein [Desulfosediminicola ganghwensis]